MSLEMAMNRLNKKFGSGTVLRASDAIGLKIRRFSTGSLALDVALGGGFVEGRINELVGQFSAYKTTLAICASKKFLQKYKDRYVIWIDVEQSFDPAWLKFLGADLKRFLVVTPTSGEEAVDIICESVKDNPGVLLIIDSIAALVPSVELENSAFKNQMGAQPRLIGKLIRRVVSHLKTDMGSDAPRATIIALNQIRMDLGVMWGDPEKTTGGKAFEHAVSIRVKLRRKEYIYEELDKDGEKVKQSVGSRVSFVIQKNKTGGSVSDRGIFTFYNRAFGFRNGGTLDNAYDLLPLGVVYGIVIRKGNTWSYKNVSATGKESFIEKMYGQNKLLELLYQDVLAAHMARLNKKYSKEPVKAKKMDLDF